MEKGKTSYAYLCPFQFGLAAGIFFGIVTFILTFIALYFGFAREFLSSAKSVWPGFEISILGAFIGLIYGFIKGFIVFGAIAWIYDALLCCCCRCNKDDSSCRPNNR